MGIASGPKSRQHANSTKTKSAKRICLPTIPQEWSGCPNDGFYKIKSLTATDTWPLKYIDFPQDGMIVSDQPPGGRYGFVYPWGSSTVHYDVVNVLHFDGCADSRTLIDYWPNLHSGGMSWRDSALWRPIEEGVEKTW